jgi:hypothetical protein
MAVRLTISYSLEDDEALKGAVETLGVTKNQVFRKGLQLIALYAKQKKVGGTIAIKNADGTYQDLIII